MEFDWYVGVDCGSDAHQLCLLNARGEIQGTRRVAHTALAVQEAVDWLRERTGVAPAAIAVAIETPRGVLVDTLIERRFPVFAVNPKQVDRFRDRFTTAGAKDDSRDAQVLADGLRTDFRAFRRVTPDDPQIIQLRELSRLLEELQTQQQRLINQLREQLFRVDAGWLRLSPAADDPWLWTVLQERPHPHQWPQMPRRQVTRVLRTHRIRRVTVEQVLTALQQPTLHAAPGVAEAVALRLETLVPYLVMVHRQLVDVERKTDRALAQLAAVDPAAGEPHEHRDAEILQSLPGVGRVVAATMLTEAVRPVAARDYATLRAYTGVAPVTKRSGKRFLWVQMRYACNHRLRQALYHWARTSLQHDAAARRYYQQLRQRGHGHARALRSVADRWLRILIAMLNTRKVYDESRFAELAA